MPKVTLTISQEQVSELNSAFAKDGKLTDNELETLTSLALTAWSDTLLGTTRFRSMTELYINWLRDIFQQLLPDEDPDEKTLVTRLNLPYGQATYVARVLRDEDTMSSRKKWIVKLESALKDKMADARAWVKDGRGEESMELYMHKYAYRELGIILSRLMEDGQAVRPVKSTATAGAFKFVLVCSADIEKLINEIVKEKARLKE